MTQLALLPRDGLFLKDGRGWYTSDVGRSHGHAWPLPPTVRGALRAAYGHHIMAERGERLTPEDWERATADLHLDTLLTLRRPARATAFTQAHRVWPVPADALHQAGGTEHGTVHRLTPDPAPRLPGLDLADPGARDHSDHEPDAPGDHAAFAGLWRPHLPTHAKPGPRPDFWTEAEIHTWLCGNAPPRGQHRHRIEGIHLTRRTDLHVTIQPDTQAATPSMLFSSDVTEPIDGAGHEWALGLACTLPGDGHARTFPAAPVLLGGRRRLALVERGLAPDLFTAPAGFFERIAGRGLRLLCVTPAAFARGWLPDGFAPRGDRYLGTLPGVAGTVILRAALVPRPLDLSTWNTVARCPRPTRRLVRPGAVYFFEKQDGPFTPDECAALWLTALGQDRADGLGLVVPGRWPIQGDRT